MKTFQRIAACGLSVLMLAGLTACDEGGASAGGNGPAATSATTAASTTTDPDANAATDKEADVIETDLYTPDGNAGLVKYLGYYDIRTDQKGTEQCLVFQSEQYGGTIDYTSCASGDAYYEKLSSLIAADDSPDILTQDALLYPGNIGKNLFEPLDSYIDYTTPLWSGMADIIESYEYNGKHYKYPIKMTTLFALNYNKKTIEENNLQDPYELYMNGQWTWDAWRQMMIDFCGKSDDNMGFYATDTILVALIDTTGTPLVEANTDGSIISNLGNSNVARAMNFYEQLNRDGIMYAKQLGDWVPPQTFATNSDKLLFLGMEPEWSYTAATEAVQNPTGVDSDIFDTVSDFSFVPFPKDPESDNYYQAFDTWGFVVPKGAKNIKGAVDMINCFRVYETDEAIIAKTREQHLSPEKITYQEGKYAGSQKWQITWGEQEYDLWRSMCNPETYNFVTEDCYGFPSTLWSSTYATLLTGVAFDGLSWAQTSAEIAPTIEASIDEYRTKS